MKLKKANEEDFESIKNLYNSIINDTPDMDKYAKWSYGKHPTDNLIREYIINDTMYLLMEGTIIAGIMAITKQQGDDYHKISWDINLSDNEVAVIHLLGVNPIYQNTGVGRKLVQEAIKIAKSKGDKAVRLDALGTNLPAQHMYQSNGFKYIDKLNLYADNTGWIDFFFYEYII